MMTDALRPVSEDDVKRLLMEFEPPVASIYIPTAPVVVEPDENFLHLKSLLPGLEQELQARGMRRPEVEGFVEPLRALLGDRDFWRHQLEGLALFRDREGFETMRLPFEVIAFKTIGPAPYARHVMPALFPGGTFYILALSKNRIRLLECSRHAVRALDLDHLDIPGNLEEALRYDDLQKPELQHHPTTGPGRRPEGQAATDESRQGRRHAFHGHGEGGESEKTQLERLLQAVDTGLSKGLLATAERPLIVAGVDYLRALFRDVTHYPHVVKEGVDGNTDRMRDEEIHELAIPIVERLTRAEVESALHSFGAARGNGLVAWDPTDLLPAAVEGRIDTLFLRRDARLWGRVVEDGTRFEPRTDPGPEDVDVLDHLARVAFLGSSRIFELGTADMIDGAEVAAYLRY